MMTDWYAMFLKSTYVLELSLLISIPRQLIASKATSVKTVIRTAFLNACLFILLLSLNRTGMAGCRIIMLFLLCPFT